MSQSQRTPRRIRLDKSPQQIADERHEELCDCLEALLHAYYKPHAAPVEDTYGGELNKSPDRSDSVTGCELQNDFLTWTAEHRLVDHDEARQRYLLKIALESLYQAHPYWHYVVTTHSRTGHSLAYLADTWEHGDHRVTKAYRDGLDFLLDELNPQDSQNPQS